MRPSPLASDLEGINRVCLQVLDITDSHQEQNCRRSRDVSEITSSLANLGGEFFTDDNRQRYFVAGLTIGAEKG